MNLHSLIPPRLLLLSALIGWLSACVAQDTDAELQKFSDALSAEIKESGKKKVALLDFGDLQNYPLEIGRYVSEQLTVNLVSAKAGFKVVDRANLKSILAEHKLTASGLIDPENAKKLGQVSGVDALVLGSVTVLGDSIQLTAKVIATDTAEIVAAAKAKLRKTTELENMISSTRSTGAKKDDNTDSKAPETVASQTVGPVEVTVKSASVRAQDNACLATITGTVGNKGKKPLAVVFKKYTRPPTKLFNKMGDSLEPDKLTGITDDLLDNSNFNPLVVEPGQAVFFVFEYFARDPAFSKSPPFQLQLSLDVADSENGRNRNIRTLEFLIPLKP